MTLAGRTAFISGASRGIGLAIAKRVADDGANIALMAKTAEPHPKLPGTVYTAAKQIEAAGGQALQIVGDIRDGDAVAAAVAQTAAQFGGRHLHQQRLGDRPGHGRRGTPQAVRSDERHPEPRHVRVSQACIPHMKGRDNPHILTLSPRFGWNPSGCGPRRT
jgi:NAD(P)-dependent dehydrogenase (short-subunit alcohol dehydrogenase family)